MLELTWGPVALSPPPLSGGETLAACWPRVYDVSELAKHESAGAVPHAPAGRAIPDVVLTPVSAMCPACVDTGRADIAGMAANEEAVCTAVGDLQQCVNSVSTSCA